MWGRVMRAGYAGPIMIGQPCTCGFPSLASYYVHHVLSRDVDGGTETTEGDIYLCAKHWPAWRAWLARREPWSFTGVTYKIIDWRATRLR